MPFTVKIQTDLDELVPLDSDTKMWTLPRLLMFNREGSTYSVKCKGISSKKLYAELNRIKALLIDEKYYYLYKYIGTTSAADIGIIVYNNYGRAK